MRTHLLYLLKAYIVIFYANTKVCIVCDEKMLMELHLFGEMCKKKKPKFILCKFKKIINRCRNIKVDKQKIEQIQNGQIQPFLVIQRCDKDTGPK